jgi:histidine triad (HIT) family protein
MSDCIFCRIVAGEIPAARVFEDEATIAFMDIGAVNPGHVLVATRAHVENVYGLDDAQAAAVMRTVARVSRAVRDAFAPAGVNLFQASGRAAGQTVFHFHVHVLPREEGDGMRLDWPVKNPPREELVANAERLRVVLRG